MKNMKLHKSDPKRNDQTQAGFTIIEVMLVLAISGLMLVGLIAGSFSSIARQRYNDALRDFSEYMSHTYNSVIRPESIGNIPIRDSEGHIINVPLGNSSTQAILGKVLVFGADYDGYTDDEKRSVYSATLVGSTDILRSSDKTFLQELAEDSNPSLVCGAKEFDEVVQMSSVETYLPLWEAYLQPTDAANDTQKFKGTMIIARTPTSATVHTAFVKDLTYDFKNDCTPDNAISSTRFVEDLKESALGRLENNYHTDEDTVICVEAQDVNFSRAVQIDANGHNSSAVKTLSEADSNSGEIRCR